MELCSYFLCGVSCPGTVVDRYKNRYVVEV